MSFVYLLVFMMKQGGAIELEEYDTWESCQAASIASYKERKKIYNIPSNHDVRNPYTCILKPA
jgi:hypothetical protein